MVFFAKITLSTVIGACCPYDPAFRKDEGFMKRTLEMKIRFTRAELDALTKKSRKAGLSREGYCRRILNGAVVKEVPPAELPLLIREVRRVGYNIDQLLMIARTKKWLIAKELEKALESSRAVEKLIVDTYTTPAD